MLCRYHCGRHACRCRTWSSPSVTRRCVSGFPRITHRPRCSSSSTRSRFLRSKNRYYPRYAGAQLIMQAARDLDLATRPLAYCDSDGQTQLAVLCTLEAGWLPAPQDHIYDFTEAESLSLSFQGDKP